MRRRGKLWRMPAVTIAAIATPPGRGGIGVVRVSGDDLAPLIEGIAGRVPPARVATLATFRAADGAPLDQGLVVYFPAPNSYTGETVVEFQGHGGPSVLRLLLARCVELGARIAEPGEFTRRAFLNGKLDLAQAESVADLIDAATATAARAAARSLEGEFSREVRALVAAVTDLRMYTEATLDFPEEDIEFLHAGDVVRRLARPAGAGRGGAGARPHRRAAARGPRGGPRGPSQRRQVEPPQSPRARGSGDRHAGRGHHPRSGRRG